MDDNEYATCIYCQVFHTSKPDGDIHVRNVLDALETLAAREQRALELYYRHELTYKQVGEEMGISASLANYTVKRVLRKLRHPSRYKQMCM